jgi:hypothetical protein
MGFMATGTLINWIYGWINYDKRSTSHGQGWKKFHYLDIRNFRVSNIPENVHKMYFYVTVDAQPRMLAVGWMGHFKTTNEPTGSDNRQLSDKIMNLYQEDRNSSICIQESKDIHASIT